MMSRGGGERMTGARRFILWHMTPATMTPIVNQISNNPPRGITPAMIRLAISGVDILLDCVNKGFDNIGNNFPSDHPGAVVAIFDTANAYREVSPALSFCSPAKIMLA